jgi:predicted amidophosphoribosyltransferase
MTTLQRIMDATITQLGLNPAPSPRDACVYCGDPMTRRGLLCDFCVAHADDRAVDNDDDWSGDNE